MEDETVVVFGRVDHLCGVSKPLKLRYRLALVRLAQEAQ